MTLKKPAEVFVVILQMHIKSGLLSVPIKIDGRYASNFLKTKIEGLENKDLVLGFLCIDSMKVFATPYEVESFSGGLEIARSIVDTLYLFFERVLICSIRNDSMKKIDSTYNIKQNKDIITREKRGKKMFILKRLATYIFNKCYSIEEVDYKRDDTEFACDGRIVRSMSETKKEACAANMLYGLTD